ncbi:uncharacterized protein LOC143849088 [Tasmannia lanceolata]|uniref:uncharacterized protein LOC143849088 n=1 Tax=Tasmannia lanceolata TaxID=3420 RepID=UPI004062E434
MGCGGSKVDDLPLVSLCRERKELIREAINQRYSFASSHVLYFKSLKQIGHSLHHFVEEELSFNPSPILSLPNSKKTNNSSTSSTSLSHSLSANSPPQDHNSSNSPPQDHNSSHLHFPSDESDEESDEAMNLPSPFSLHSGPSSPPTASHYSSYMRSSTGIPNIVHEEHPQFGTREGYFGVPNRDPYVTNLPSPSSLHSTPPHVSNYSAYMRSSTGIPNILYEEHPQSPQNYPQFGIGGGYFGGPNHDPYYDIPGRTPPPAAVPPPPPPEVSAWDFLNPFNSFESVYPSYGYGNGIYGVGSNASSPDSDQVREREGIPDLEDETEQEPLKESHLNKKDKKLEEDLDGEGTSRAAPTQSGDGDGTRLPREKKSDSSSQGNGTQLPQGKKSDSSSQDSGSKHTVVDVQEEEEEEDSARKKGVSFGAGTALGDSIESSQPSSHATLSTHRSRNIREVVNEIRDQFEIASELGNEMSVMLESNKLRYQPRNPILKAISCRMLDAVSPSTLISTRSLSKRPQRTSSNARKMGGAGHGHFEKSMGMKSGNLSSTLEKLYAWEKKLYKEVKDEEKLRIIYEKQCKRLKNLDDRGAETTKIDATEASIRKLLTKMSITIKAVAAISSRIHKLRDEELQPQLTELIQGLIRMWRNLVKCHQKQFQAIVEGKLRNVIGKTGIRRDSSMRATMELEMELLSWSNCFNKWISSQKAYVEALNGWLLKCLLNEPEETPDGIVPFSPSRIGAPPVFIICNDWYNAMERISELEVTNAMHNFAKSVHKLWERQDEEQRQKLKAEYLSKDLEKRLKSLREEGRKIRGNLDGSDKSAVSLSPDDEQRAAFDSMKNRLDEERAKHKETIKQVHEAVSGSLEMGLIPIFEAMENFTSQTLKAYEEVRIQSVEGT